MEWVGELEKGGGNWEAGASQGEQTSMNLSARGEHQIYYGTIQSFKTIYR